MLMCRRFSICLRALPRLLLSCSPFFNLAESNPLGSFRSGFRALTVASWMQPPSLTRRSTYSLVDQDFRSVAQGTVSASPSAADLSAYELSGLHCKDEPGREPFRRGNQGFPGCLLSVTSRTGLF